MIKDVVKASESKQEVANLELNYFEQYGSQVSQKAIAGQLLKFSKGDWLTGEDNKEIALGTKFSANMDQLMVGWIKWIDNRPEQQIMGLVVEGYQAAKRNTLGDEDEAAWEVGTDGKPRDPWQFSNYLVMKTPSKKVSEDELYTFATSSRGGLGAIGDLCKQYGREMRQRVNEYPVVEIGVNSYVHSNKEFGRIKIPTLKIVGWEPKELFVEAVDQKKNKNGKRAA